MNFRIFTFYNRALGFSPNKDGILGKAASTAINVRECKTPIFIYILLKRCLKYSESPEQTLFILLAVI